MAFADEVCCSISLELVRLSPGCGLRPPDPPPFLHAMKTKTDCEPDVGGHLLILEIFAARKTILFSDDDDGDDADDDVF